MSAFALMLCAAWAVVASYGFAAVRRRIVVGVPSLRHNRWYSTVPNRTAGDVVGEVERTTADFFAAEGLHASAERCGGEEGVGGETGAADAPLAVSAPHLAADAAAIAYSTLSPPPASAAAPSLPGRQLPHPTFASSLTSSSYADTHAASSFYHPRAAAMPPAELGYTGAALGAGASAQASMPLALVPGTSAGGAALLPAHHVGPGAPGSTMDALERALREKEEMFDAIRNEVVGRR